MKVYVKFRVHAEEKRNFTNSFFFFNARISSKTRNKGEPSKHR